MGKRETNIHIMHSMKGGCGKSACALFKALQLAGKNSDIKEKRARVLFIDVDFKGSAMQKLLFEEPRTEDSTYEKLLQDYSDHIVKGDGLTHQLTFSSAYDSKKNLNNYLKGEYEVFAEVLNRSFSFNIGNSVEEGAAYGELCNNGFIDFVFSSSEQREKEWFRGGSKEALATGVYTYRMSVFLRQALKYGTPPLQDEGQYSDIVIDMPPGYDEYSDLILRELHKLSDDKKQIKMHYYSVTTNDVGHMHLTIGNVKSALEKSTNNEPWDSVNVILNCMTEDDFLIRDKKMNEINNDVITLFKLINNKGEIFKCAYMGNYHKFCRSYGIKCFECPAKFSSIRMDENENLSEC